MQTRVASKRSGWENSRVEIKFAGKSEIYTVGRPLDPLVLWPYLSIFFPSGGNENCDNFGYFHSYEISSAFSDRIPMERKIEEKKQREKRKRILFARDIFCERENSVSSFFSLRGYISLPERSSSAKIISQIGEGNPPFDFFLAQFRSFRNAF